MLSTIQTQAAPAAIGPYSQGMVAGDLVFVSGQLGLDPQSGALKGQDLDAQAHQALTNLKAVLKAVQGSLRLISATTKSNVAPMPPASVGVKNPR